MEIDCKDMSVSPKYNSGILATVLEETVVQGLNLFLDFTVDFKIS